jgi:hypothetical protein
MTYQYCDNNCVISTGDSVYFNTISIGNIQINYALFNINSDRLSMSNGMIHFLRNYSDDTWAFSFLCDVTDLLIESFIDQLIY